MGSQQFPIYGGNKSCLVVTGNNRWNVLFSLDEESDVDSCEERRRQVSVSARREDVHHVVVSLGAGPHMLCALM